MQERIKELAVECGARKGQYERWYMSDAALTAVVQAVARECAEIAAQTTEYGALDEHGETKAYATEAAIRARFGLGE